MTLCENCQKSRRLSHSRYIAGVHLLYQSQHYLLNAYFSPPYQSHWQVILANWQEIAAKKVLFPPAL